MWVIELGVCILVAINIALRVRTFICLEVHASNHLDEREPDYWNKHDKADESQF